MRSLALVLLLPMLALGCARAPDANEMNKADTVVVFEHMRVWVDSLHRVACYNFDYDLRNLSCVALDSLYRAR